MLALNSSRSGLGAEDAARRLREHGPNELPETARRHPFFRFLAHFHNALIYFLLAAVIATTLLGHYVDAAVILAVVLVNAIVGFVQEGKAEAALSAIRGLIAPHVHVIRGGRRETAPVSDIVPGDLVLLEAGDRIPADLRLIRSRSLLIEEAILTGESVAAEKRETPAPADAALGDRHSMAYSGTFVAAGQATGVAVGTGVNTEIGRISTLLKSVETLETPLLRQIDRFGTQFTWITIAVAAALFTFAIGLRGFDWPDALVAVVALAVGAIPEGLPAVITITLAIGVQRMAKRNAAIRRLPAVETLGATSVICSDKTGTLTRNEMMANRIELSGGRITVTGTGYTPDGTLEPSANQNRGPDNAVQIFVKGAPEQILNMCGTQATANGSVPLDTEYWSERIAVAAADGERLLGLAACGPFAPEKEQIGFTDLEDGLVFLGLVGFIDPPRKEAIDAIAECRSAGIEVKMITGDHAATAAAIARQLGFAEDPHVLTGHELDRLADEDLSRAVADTTVFARTSPEHKLRIVRALQSTGAVVAMTGDGVNDAPSLKQADIGIAMGEKGTDAAKEAARMVLLDDNFASIVAAVREGRVVYDNIRKVVAWTLPTNGGEALIVIAAILFGFALPMSPVQILWINLITAATLGLVLAFEPAEPDVMRRRPRPANQGLLTSFLVWRVVLVSFLFLGAALAFYFYALSKGADLATARTMVVNAIVVLEIFYLFNVRYLRMTSFNWQGVLGTPAVLLAISVVVLAQFAFTYMPIMQRLFDTRPISLGDGLLIVAAGVAVMVLLEIEKRILRRTGRLTLGG